jgi:tyrosine-protein kinase Etk/Wzc
MPTTQDVPPTLKTPPDEGLEVNLLDLLLPLVDHKYVILLATFLGLLFAMLATLLTPAEYTGKAVIMPPQQGQSSAGLISQLGPLASLSGFGGAALHDPNDLYLALLQSEAVEDFVIDRLNLQSYYHLPSYYARLLLSAKSKFSSERGGLISISVRDRDPKKAATIANAYVGALHSLNDTLIITEASRRADFFARELARQRSRLEDAETALQETEQATGIIAPSNQASLIIQRIAGLQSEISSLEVQLDSLRLSSTDRNPDVVHLNSQLAILRSQLRALESGGKDHVPGDVLLTSQSVPNAQLTYNRKFRDVSYQTYLVDLIERQYEAAKLDEAKAAPVIQLVDPARPPEKKSSPARTLWTLVGGALSFVVSCLVIVGAYLWECVRRDRMLVSRLEPFRRALRAGF